MIATRGIVTLLCFAAIWSGCGFARVESSWSPDPPGFFIGIWAWPTCTLHFGHSVFS
jgi:hypothetical protein